MEGEKPENSGRKDEKNRPEKGEIRDPAMPINPDSFRLAGWDILEKTPEVSSGLKAAEPAPLKNSDLGHPDSENPLGRRTKSSQRLKYEAEVGVIRKKLGDLDEIREKLGLTQRKMCQLLLVDPSAWTRWTRDEEDAPPHIYRMLQWYLALEEKYPALDVNFWLSTVSRGEDPNKSSLRDEKIQNLTQNLAGVSREVEALRYELANQAPEPSPTTLSMQEIESRLALVQKRERLLLVWCALFFAGVAFGLLLHRFG